MQKNIIISIMVSALIVIGAIYFVSVKPDPINTDGVKQSLNVDIKDGVQRVMITAKGGYFPRFTEINGGLPTKLIVKTDGTFDCSASLLIRSIKFRKILQPTGEEVIDLGTLKSGDKIQGVCGMGMYSFIINVK